MVFISLSGSAMGYLFQAFDSPINRHPMSTDDPSLEHYTGKSTENSQPSSNHLLQTNQVFSVQEQITSSLLSNVTSWLCVYADVSADDILQTDYDLVDIDPDEFRTEEIPRIKESGKIVIAYLSIGEAEDYRYYWDPKADYLLEENPEWPGCWYVDYTNIEWQQIIINDYIPMIQNKGFDGLYLDTVETYQIEEQYPNCTKDAMVNFVTAISDSYRSGDFCIIMQNGLDIASDLLDDIDGVAVEETYFRAVYGHLLGWHINGIPQKPAVRRYNEQQMTEVLHHGMVVFTLDYAVLPFQVNRCYIISQAEGFIPYVSTAQLNRIIPNRHISRL
jgi:uncharacterized protein (TIGR01370 family)